MIQVVIGEVVLLLVLGATLGLVDPCFTTMSKSGCQSQDSSRANPEAIGSPITLYPVAQEQVTLLLQKLSDQGIITLKN